MKLLIRLTVWIILLALLYIGSYFLLMEKGTAINRKSFLPEYSSITRFGEAERKIGPLSIQVTYSSWLNPIYEPLDQVFRKSHTAPLKLDIQP